MLYDAKLATDFANDMLEKGIYVIGFSFPVVPKDKARIRVQLSAVHTTEHGKKKKKANSMLLIFSSVNKAVDAFIEIGKKRGVLKK